MTGIVRSVLRPWRQYQRWVIERELHIAKATNPLNFLVLIWNAAMTAALPLAATTLLAFAGWSFRQTNHATSFCADGIAIVAVWFGLSVSRDTALVKSIKTVCHRAANNNLVHANGYKHVEQMIQKFHDQLRFYNIVVISMNIIMLFVGIVLSFI